MTHGRESPQPAADLAPIPPSVIEAGSEQHASAGSVAISGISNPNGTELPTPRANGTYADDPARAPFYMQRGATNDKGIITPSDRRNNTYWA